MMSVRSLRNVAPIAIAGIVAGFVGPAGAVIVLDFEGISPTYPGSAGIYGFYNGGTSNAGTSGPNYGIAFTNNAQTICLNIPGVQCSNTSRGGLGNPSSARSGLTFGFRASQTYMNVVSGFDVGFSFYYVGINSGGRIDVYDELSGSGNLLASVVLPTTPSGCGGMSPYAATFCPFYPIGVAFVGTAKSVSFSGVASQLVFDDVTFGSVVPGVPEPASYASLLCGLTVMSYMVRRRSLPRYAAA